MFRSASTDACSTSLYLYMMLLLSYTVSGLPPLMPAQRFLCLYSWLYFAVHYCFRHAPVCCPLHFTVLVYPSLLLPSRIVLDQPPLMPALLLSTCTASTRLLLPSFIVSGIPPLMPAPRFYARIVASTSAYLIVLVMPTSVDGSIFLYLCSRLYFRPR